MKHGSLRILAIMMSLFMIVGLTACGGNGDDTSSAAPHISESSTPEISAPESSGPEASEPDVTETTTGDKNTDKTEADKSTGITTSTTKKDISTTSKTTTTTTKATTTTASTGKKPAKSKTWAEVKALIPSDASGKTVVIREWGEINTAAGVDKLNANFEKETGIKIKHEVANYDIYFSKLSAEVSAKNTPDVVRVQNPKRKELTYLQPINQATSYDFTDRVWDETLMGHWTFNGNTYAVNMDGSPLYSAILIFYNKNLINDYNLDDPYELWKKGKWTWDKMLDMCEEFLDEVKDESYSGFTHMEGMEYFFAWGIEPVEYNRTTGQFKCNFQEPAFFKAAQAYAKICDDGLRDKQLSNAGKFGGGKILFAIWNSVTASKGGNTFSALRKQKALACVPLPALKSGMDDVQVLNEVQGYGIPKTAKNAELVPFYLRYLLDKTNYDMKNYYDAENAAEVITYIQKKQPKVNTSFMIMSQETCGYPPNRFLDELANCGVEQVKKILDSLGPATEAAAKDATKFYAQL